jgi:hypothetical protein
MMLTDKEADDIRRGLAAGMRGPGRAGCAGASVAVPVAWAARWPEDYSSVMIAESVAATGHALQRIPRRRPSSAST